MFNFGREVIVIYQDCNTKNDSYTEIGFTYKPPDGIAYDSKLAKTYLGGEQ